LEQVIDEQRGSKPEIAEEAETFLDALKDEWWPQQPLPGRRGLSGAIVRALNVEHPLGSLQAARRQVADFVIALTSDCK
jgi:hypothetical protein